MGTQFQEKVTADGQHGDVRGAVHGRASSWNRGLAPRKKGEPEEETGPRAGAPTKGVTCVQGNRHVSRVCEFGGQRGRVGGQGMIGCGRGEGLLQEHSGLP